MRYVSVLYKIAELKQKKQELAETLDEYLAPIRLAVVGSVFASKATGKSFRCSSVSFNIYTENISEQVVLSGPYLTQKRYEQVYGHCYYDAPTETTIL